MVEGGAGGGRGEFVVFQDSLLAAVLSTGV